MKKIWIGLFILFILVAGTYAVIQSDIGKNYVRNKFTKELEEAGLSVEIDRVEGTIPQQIDLKGVKISADGMEFAVQEIKLRPVLWRLFRNEIALNDIHAKGISVSGSPPFDFDGKLRIKKKKAILSGSFAGWEINAQLDRTEKLVQFEAKHNYLTLVGTSNFNPDYSVITTKINWTALDEVTGKGEAVWAERKLKGELTADGAKATFDLEVKAGGLLSGVTNLNVENIHLLKIPNAYGKLQAKGVWENDTLRLDGMMSDFYYNKLFVEKGTFYSDLKDPLTNISGLIDFQVEKVKWHELSIENGSLITKRSDGDWDFSLFAEGKWNHPLELHVAGTWKDQFQANIENMNGTFFNHPFELSNPVRLEITKERFLLQDMEVTIAGGNAFVHIDRNGDDTDSKVRFDQIPLDFLSLNPLDVSVTGTVNLRADIKERNNKLQGTLEASIAQMEVASLGIMEKSAASGEFQGSFTRELLKLKGNLLIGQEPILSLNLALPIQFSIWPFDAELLIHKNARGQLSLKGRVEDFLDFFDLGPHRLEGQCDCKLKFSNNLYRPLVEGTLVFQDGYYQNYYTGTELQNIQARFLAEKNKIYLQSLTAEDNTKTGTLEASGVINLLQADRYPFELDAQIKNLKFVEIDLVQSIANGNIRIEGNALSAIAKGEVELVKSDLSIPDHISRPLPNLQVVYRNPIQPVETPQVNEYTPYPLYLDLRVLAPNNVTIAGRGLQSEWKGDFQVGGTYTTPAAKGKLELIEGEFNFSSRSFKLTEGSLSLSGVENQLPYLNLAATNETKGITITARLKGPLNDPQITLQSTPPLPLGSIMSYLLFGQDISEVSGFQALQLATSLASLAGTGPDVMESTRRALGVDRLRVISDPTEEGGETVALQVGKYISKGVLVSFSQGVDESSTNISVEVELKDNFVFQIESDQHQEQGKFTLKWSLNY